MIKAATDSDREILARLIREAYGEVARRFSLTRDNCPKHPSQCTAAWIEGDMARGVHYHLLYYQDEPAGCVAVEKAGADICYVERLAVLPAMRGRHFGKRLVLHALQYAAAQGAARASIGIIDEQAELKAWYAQFGFVETQTKTFAHLPFTVCLMEAELQNISGTALRA